MRPVSIGEGIGGNIKWPLCFVLLAWYQRQALRKNILHEDKGHGKIDHQPGDIYQGGDKGG